ncbi:hypothetical protein JST99_02735 [Candidatus Dependentiae bacterium]|nr:hypothetical protein [Candidatus Dependentiae bacterium]MCC7415199.1 hypothetical protein [Campylobacterota bacterium]
MMKKLLTAAFAVAALSLVPSAEARSCRRKCEPKAQSCEKPCAPECTTDVQIVGEKLIPVKKMVCVDGYKTCPIKETTTCCTKRSTRCCPEEMSCAKFADEPGYDEAKGREAHGGKNVSADIE